jgi:secondary thiamine-phosphate synthase enzyme
MEGNSPAHIKTLITGTSATLVVEGGEPVLGHWQAVYLCEYDGPRHRRMLVEVLESGDKNA